MKKLSLLLVSALLVVAGCNDGHGHEHEDGAPAHDEATEAEGHEEDEHDHPEESLGSVRIGGLDVELAQGHGAVEPGKECHLVVKLPYSDGGTTVVRAWIGTEDRTLSLVAKAEYAASHGDYDAHVMAPDPLPAGVQWWVELEKPDGSKVVGSAQPLM